MRSCIVRNVKIVPDSTVVPVEKTVRGEKRMKKVGIVSCYFHPNYGSMLQAYATQKILDDLGVENETICIDGIKGELNKAKTRHYLRQIGNPDILAGTILRIGKRKLYRMLKKDTFGKQVSVRNACFQQFSKEQFRVSEAYASREELTKACDGYSSVLVGSDQLWLASNIEADYYTLTWVPDEVNKIAYATSFGVSSLPEYLFEKTKTFLNRIEHIGVREEKGKELVKHYTGRDVPLVCDPTLLFDAEDWMCIQKQEPVVEGSYIFCYFLGNNTEDRAFAKRLREATGYKIVALLHLDEYISKDCDYADETPYEVGPGEFVNLIRNAAYICTDSFHGSVFSILHKKQFFTSMRIRKEGVLCTNNRIDSLFATLGVEGRKIDGSEDVKECMARTLDYDAIHQRIAEFRGASVEYLENALAIQ